jgi:hypothetical protein
MFEKIGSFDSGINSQIPMIKNLGSRSMSSGMNSSNKHSQFSYLSNCNNKVYDNYEINSEQAL